MTDLLSILAATTPTTTSTKSSGSGLSFILPLLLVGAFYFFFIRPRQARQRQARAQVGKLEMGATVMSVGGIKGTVVGLDDIDVQVEVAPGVVLTFIRRAVNAQAAPVVPEPEDYDAPTHGSGVQPGAVGTDGDPPAGRFGYDEPEDRPGTGTEGH